MKQILAFALLVVGIGTVVTAQAPKPATDDRSELIGLTRQLADGVAHRDDKSIDKILADDFAFTHSNGIVMNRAEELKNVADPNSHWTGVKVEIGAVRFFGDVGIVTGSQTFTGDAKGFATGRRLFTHIFVKQKGQWRCVGGQFTMAPTRST